ncbi:uncharacterized protein TrAFT101_009841 [Trichoderma asperellum]|uniref:uncharacterized protein n=1 Tax=Trichoderma asperellum TaxID=101201 RepID=UPI00331A071C|nr:hypothetical protein TrAFT101_009841 [Trichoderma asperellum]
MGSSKPKSVPSNLAGTTCETRPRRDHLRAPWHSDAMESNQTKFRTFRMRGLPGATALLSGQCLRWSADGSARSHQSCSDCDDDDDDDGRDDCLLLLISASSKLSEPLHC